MATIDLNRIAQRWAAGNQQEIRQHVEELFQAIRTNDREGVRRNLGRMKEGQTILDLRMPVRNGSDLFNVSALSYAIDMEEHNSNPGEYKVKISAIGLALLSHYQNEEADIGKSWAIEPLQKALSLGNLVWIKPLWEAGHMDQETKTVHKELMLQALRAPHETLRALFERDVMKERLIQKEGHAHHTLADLLMDKILDRVVKYPLESVKHIELLQELGVDVRNRPNQEPDLLLFQGVVRCLNAHETERAKQWCEGLIDLGFDPLMKNGKGFDLLQALSRQDLTDVRGAPLDLTFYEAVRAKAEHKLLMHDNKKGALSKEVRLDSEGAERLSPTSVTNRLRV